jgi:hypothetical protein
LPGRTEAGLPRAGPGASPRRAAQRTRRETKKTANSKPAEHGLPFSTWSLVKSADCLVFRGWSTTSATRACESCSERKTSPQCVKTWKASREPDYAARKARVEHHEIAGGEVIPEEDEPEIVYCMDEFGSLDPQPRSARIPASFGRDRDRDRRPWPVATHEGAGRGVGGLRWAAFGLDSWAGPDRTRPRDHLARRRGDDQCRW